MPFFDRFIPKELRDRVLAILAANRRIAIIIGAALAVALLAVTLLWSAESGYSVLYAGLSGQDGGRTIAELQKLNIAYRITEGGRVIMVPTADVGRARLQLAARGVPKTDRDAWTSFDNTSLSVSPFAEQVHYVRAIETSLAHTIGEVDGVVSAEVMLGLPKQTSFLGDAPKPSGSVMLRLRPGTLLSAAQVEGIVGLVAASVPGLARENVTVVDQTGRRLNQNGDDALSQLPQQLEIVRTVNSRYEAMVTELLTPVLGARNFRVSADSDLDFSKTKENLTKFGDSHVLSQDESTHAASSDGAAIGIPGALSNRPPDNPTTQVTPPAPVPPAAAATGAAGAQDAQQPKPAPAPPNDTHKTTNYEIDRTVQSLEHPGWSLRGINIAVLINNTSANPISAERIQSIDKLVSAAIGSTRSPHVSVVDLPFDEAMASGQAGAESWWRQPAIKALRDNVVLALAGLLVLWGGVLPLLHWVERVHQSLPVGPLRTATAGNVNITIAQDAQRPGWSIFAGQRRTAGGGSGGGGDGTSREERRFDPDIVRALAATDPARTAQVIKGWIAHGRGGGDSDT
jgi:flagellar M-ring protein FliF